MSNKREILFRGKRIDTGEWVEGCLLIDYVSGQYFIHANGNSANESEEVNGEGCLLIVAFEIAPGTVCEYTGLTDKNGRKIFEGDIVKLVLPNGEIRYFKATIKSVVRKVLCYPDFDDDFSRVEITGIVFEWNGYELFPCVDTYGIPDYRMMEVIGNIFDNPELMEEA